MTQPELRRFIKACLRDGREDARALASEALKRLQERAS